MKIVLNKARYKFFDYEDVLSKKEVCSLLHPRSIKKYENHWVVSSSIEDEKILIKNSKRLTYFHSFEINESVFETDQKLLEEKCSKSGKAKRQSTKYGAHGVHDYKGKFNPQVVSSLINIFNLNEKSIILDPFCGSGTVMLEAKYKGINAIGVDINPMAAFIANTKLQSSSKDAKEIKGFLNAINKRLLIKKNQHIENSSRINYLSKWLDEDHIFAFENLKNAINEVDDLNSKNILLCCASNTIRDYSLQDPDDLRIRRRKSPMPEKPMLQKFLEECESYISNISAFEKVDEIKPKAYNRDIRSDLSLKDFKKFDAAITSPPYATALPYIDTQRLSLIWLGLSEPEEIKSLEWSLIGSREATKSNIKELQAELVNNQNDIPKKLHALCMDMVYSLDESDGFRRKAVPYLMYRYFTDMQSMFINVAKKLKKNAPFALVVGHNHTTLGGKRYDLDTPSYLCSIAASVGWSIQENMPLETYHRYGLHSKNAVNSESLLFLRKLG